MSEELKGDRAQRENVEDDLGSVIAALHDQIDELETDKERLLCGAPSIEAAVMHREGEQRVNEIMKLLMLRPEVVEFALIMEEKFRKHDVDGLDFKVALEGLFARLAADDAAPLTGAELIVAERNRQMEKEGWTPEHDAQHVNGQITEAAVCYALNKQKRPPNGCMIGSMGHGEDVEFGFVHPAWPWHSDWDKREKHDRIKSLSIAGALLAAEIDRLLAAELREDDSDGSESQAHRSVNVS